MKLEVGGFGEAVLLVVEADGVQFFDGAFELAGEAGFLQVQVGERLLEGQENFGFDEGGAGVGGFVGVGGGELLAAQGEEASFEGRDAEETPFDLGEGLEEESFFVGGGLPFFVEAVEMGLPGGEVVGGQENGAAGESGFQGVVGGAGFAFRSFRAGRELCVLAVGFGFGHGNFQDQGGARVFGARSDCGVKG